MFLSTLEDAVGLHGLKVFGYRLMANHYHLLLETPLGNLSRAMGWFQATSTIRFNRNHRRSGHLFQSRRVPFPLINGYRFRNTAGVAERLSRKNLNHIHTEPLKRKIVKRLVERESIPWQIWLRVYHGGEKRVDVARSPGYKDGSAITHIPKRLDKQCKDEPTVANHAVFLTKKLRDISSFKASWPHPRLA